MREIEKYTTYLSQVKLIDKNTGKPIAGEKGQWTTVCGGHEDLEGAMECRKSQMDGAQERPDNFGIDDGTSCYHRIVKCTTEAKFDENELATAHSKDEIALPETNMLEKETLQ